jgi:hypothetical protein
MKFGIFYEHQLPRPRPERSEYQLLQESPAQIELADRLGYDYAREVEHHLPGEYSHSSAPEVFLGAASQRTTTACTVDPHPNEDIVRLTPEELHRRMAEKEAAARAR